MKFIRRPSFSQGFTLVEVLVTVAILSILVGVIAVSSAQSSQKSRDAERQADLRTLQSAIELYKNKYGRYPEGCAGGDDGWSGQSGTNYACDTPSEPYILGATGRLFSDFMAKLPIDPKLNGNDSGYIYHTNAAGTVYKLKAHRTVESEVVDYTHKLKACDIRVASDASGNLLSGSNQREAIGWCGIVQGSSPATNCNSTSEAFYKSYGVWGGFEPKTTPPADTGSNFQPVRETTKVICK